jgi:hypothetical protein
MKKICVYKAQPITNNEEVKSVTIHINAEIPPVKTLEDAEIQYQEDANQLIDALFYSLPQGTFDRLMIAIMQKKVSLYCGTTNS